MFRDVTAAKRAGEALQRAEARYSLLIDSLPLTMWNKDLEGRFLFCNQLNRSSRYLNQRRFSMVSIVSFIRVGLSLFGARRSLLLVQLPK